MSDNKTGVDKEKQGEESYEQQVIKTLEEDDEFEDFPEDTNWSNEANPQLNPSNLWEEDWEDVDNQDDFTQKLREELKKAHKTV